jgi:hypothetical protein
VAQPGAAAAIVKTTSVTTQILMSNLRAQSGIRCCSSARKGRVRNESAYEGCLTSLLVCGLASRQLPGSPLSADGETVCSGAFAFRRKNASRAALRIKERVMPARRIGVANSLCVDCLMEGALLIGRGFLRGCCARGEARKCEGRNQASRVKSHGK